MKRIEFTKVNTASFFLLPAIGFVRTSDWVKEKYYYKFCVAWLRFHFSIVFCIKHME